MKEFDGEPGQEEYWSLVSQALKNRREIKSTSHEGWCITSYVGCRYDLEPDGNVTHIEYSASAKTGDLAKSQSPNMSTDPRAIRVDFDDTSVVMLTANNTESLTTRLQEIFAGFQWE